VKSIFASRVFWGSFLGLITTLTPATTDLVEGRGKKSDHIQTIVLALTAFGLNLVGRVGAGGVFTPKYCPGPDRPDPKEYDIEPVEY
jgi:hypothetical protein